MADHTTVSAEVSVMACTGPGVMASSGPAPAGLSTSGT
jgi:hypothetical protein